jgi:hypothetical protein
MKLILAAAMIAALASVVAASPNAEVAAGAPAAEPQRVCLNVRDIRSRRAISNDEIRFEMSNGEIWINRLKRSCPNLRFENAFAWDVSGGFVCSNQQTIYVLNHGNHCQLGEFRRAEEDGR